MALKFQECENKVNDSSELFVRSCYVDMNLLVIYVLTCGHKRAVLESQAPN